jgi:NDP-sugar pyrophosphorylase family protein
MDAIVTAGGIPQPGEPLYEFTLGASKAMLDVVGKPMIQWVLDALEDAQTIDGIVIIGLPPDSEVVSTKVMARIPNQGGMVDNISANKVLEMRPGVSMCPCPSDIPDHARW